MFFYCCFQLIINMVDNTVGKIYYVAPNHGLPSRGMSDKYLLDTPMLPTCMEVMKTGYDKQGNPIWEILCREYMTKQESKQFVIPYVTKLSQYHNIPVPYGYYTQHKTYYIVETEYWMKSPDGRYTISLPRIIKLVKN